MLEIEKTEGQGVIVLSLKGQLDALTAGKLKPVIDDLIEAGAPRVVYNLEALELIDSSGIGAFVSTFKRTRAAGGDTKLACIDGQPREVFQVLGFHRYIDVYDSVDKAIQKLVKNGHPRGVT
jgi:anti-sigma B factor antagonist